MAILAVMTAGAYITEMAPALRRHEAVLAGMRHLKEQQLRKRDTERALVAVRQRSEEATRSIAEAGFTLDSTQRENERLARITAMAASAGLQVDGLEPSAAVPSGNLAAVTIRLSAKGGYMSVSRFIRLLRDQWPDCVVTSIEIAATPAAREPVATAHIQIIWHATPHSQLAGN